MTDDATPYVVPKDPGRWRAFALAALVHGALIGVLWFSVHWQNETPVAIEAEVWSPDVRAAAPVAPPPPPPEPEPETRPAPQPKVVAPPPPPPPPPPKPVVVEPPKVNPDIALAQEKKRKEEKLKRERLEDEREARVDKQKADREAVRREKLEADKEQARRELAAEKERAKLDQQKLAEAKRRDQEKADALNKKLAADAKKKSADEAREKLERADVAQREKARNEDLARMMAQAGSGGSGSAPKSQGPQGDPGYGSKIASKIRANTIFNVPGNLNGNPIVEYTVNLLPDGSLRRPIRKVRSSGVPGFDEAVLNAIERSEPFPADKTGKVPEFVTITHKPKD